MKLRGTVLPALITPFDKNLEVDYPRAAKLAERLVEAGCDGVVVAGTTGESPTLSAEEKSQLFETIVEAVGDRVFVWAGTGSNNTAASIALTRRAEAAGADGIMLVTPYYNKPSQEGLYQHFATIAATTRLPVMVYNVPGRTSANVLPATVARLAEVDNIVAVKEASGDLNQVSQVVVDTPRDFDVYAGDDSLTLPLMSVGGVGVVSVAAHVVPGQLRQMVDAFRAGRLGEAAELHQRLFPLFRALFVTSNPVPVKAALRLIGFDPGGYRLPLVPPTPEEEEVVRQALVAAEVLE